MKFRKFLKILIVIIFIPALLFSVSCKNIDDENAINTSLDTELSGGLSPFDLLMDGSPRDSVYKLGGDSSISGDSTDKPKIEPGQLTASALFDNDNYEYFYSLTESSQDEENVFQSYQSEFKISLNRVAVKITNGPLVKVQLIFEDKIEFEAYTDKNGICYLFNDEKRDEYDISVHYFVEKEEKVQFFKIHDGDEITLDESSTYGESIQIMFVIDTTGSMGDEIDYLKSELQNVIERINDTNSETTIYLALMFYRDSGDEYLTRYFDFTTDIERQIENLSKQDANGGGDIPEAVQVAFAETVEKQWLSLPSTKILIHVADAPSHDEDVQSWFKSVNKLASMGVRIINIASSEIDKMTEFLYRCQCAQTNGCYAFLTNHSGIGNEHIEATVSEELVVEFLNDLLVRVINGMHTGTYAEPTSYTQNQQ